MSRQEDLMDRRRVETSQPCKSANKQICRLYPSLPIAEKEREMENLLTSAHAESLWEETQCEVSSISSDARLKAQIVFLEEQTKQLLSINEKWAKEYRTMVKYYKEKMKVSKASEQHKEDKCDRGEDFKEEASSQAGEENPELLKAKTEAEELRVQNRSLTRRGQHQEAEIKRLNKAVEEALQSSQPLVSSETLQDIWKHQADTYKDDFFRERKDREKLKDKYLELEKKFQTVYRELRLLKSQVTWVLQPQPKLPCTCSDRAKSPQREVRKVNQNHVHLQRRHTLNSKQ